MHSIAWFSLIKVLTWLYGYIEHVYVQLLYMLTISEFDLMYLSYPKHDLDRLINKLT